MPLLHLLLKRLWTFLGLGIGTMLLILGLNLNPIPSNAQLIPVQHNPPTQASQSTKSALDLVRQGKTYYQKGQLQDAVNVWQKAVDIFVTQSDRLHQAMTLSYLAQAYQHLGIWDQANMAIAQSLELLKQNNQRAKGDYLHILAEAYTTKGSLEFDQGKASAASKSWQDATKTFQKAGDSPGMIRSQINESQAFVTLGLYKQANNLLGSLYEKLPPEKPLQLAIRLNYGETLRLVGQLQVDTQPNSDKPSPRNSVDVLQEGLDQAKKLNSPEDIAAAQLSLGNTYRAIEQQQKRLKSKPCPDYEYYKKAEESYKSAEEQTNSPTSKIQALLNQQSLLFDNDPPIGGKQQIQAQIQEQIQAIASKIQSQLTHLPLNRNTLYIRIQLAYNLLKLCNNDSDLQAISILETTVQQAENLGDYQAQSYALGYLGHSYEHLSKSDITKKQITEALKLTRQALDLANNWNIPEIAYRWSRQLGRLYRETDSKQAIQYYYDAYQTLENLRAKLAPDNPEIDFSFRERSIEPVYRELVDLLLQPQIVEDPKTLEDSQLLENFKPKTNNQDKQDLHIEKPLMYPIYTARRVIQDLQSAKLSNFLQEPCAFKNIKAIDTEINKSDSSTVFLYAITLHDRIEVIARFPGKPLFHNSFPISESEVQQKVNQFQLDLQESYTFDQVKSEGQEIYQWLIEPVEKQLKDANIQTIVFSLDEPLRNIPMAALYDGQKYLIEKYAVSVTLDLDIKEPKPLKKDRLNVLAAGLAHIPKKFHHEFGNLKFVPEELNSIQRSIPKTKTNRVIKLEDKSFTRTLFNEKFADSPFQIVHLATHGEFSSKPEKTFILTSDYKVGLQDFDDMFRTRGLNRVDTIGLLILSACETATDDDRATLGIAGVAVRAGANSAIASLWSLDDRSSQKLMTEFYKTIIKPKTSRAKALQQAQVALLRDKDQIYAHPRYWASFLLVGNWL